MFTRFWKAPPIDVFPAYDQPPAPIANDYLTDPDYPLEAYFSNQGRRPTGFLFSNFVHFSMFGKNAFLT
jgi:hypothetical protein